MRHLTRLIRSFGADERGVFAMLFGLMAVVLIALAGAVVDFVTLQQARNRAQSALDAAALALQPRIFEEETTDEQLRALAEALVIERIGDDRITASVDSAVSDDDAGSLILNASLAVPTYFVELVGVPELRAGLLSEATRKMLDLEVMMVLDNSGSMAGSRMRNLKSAAECATNILFYDTVDDDCEPTGDAEAKDNVRIGIVPFTIMVNVGTQFEDENWLDWEGESPLASLNFDNDDDDSTPFNGPVSRADLFETTDTEWKGCVEARQSPYDTNDVPPDTPETMFVPMFSPDTTQHMGNTNNYLGNDSGGSCQVKTCRVTYIEAGCSTGWGWTWCSGPRTNYQYKRIIGSTITNLGSTSCLPNNPTQIADATATSVVNGKRTVTADFSLLSPRELQERLCKYNGARPSDWGPNADCPVASVLPLTNDPNNVLDRIDDMDANGNTNIQQGSVWGLHALTDSEPLIEAAPRSDGTVSKALIIMTDGKNEPRVNGSTNGSSYFSWGFGKDLRLSATAQEVDTQSEMQAVMDAKTVATCASAKDLNIIVYTIGLNPPNDETETMLTNCSSGEGYHFFPEDPSELEDTFREIAGQLAQLRLAQ